MNAGLLAKMFGQERQWRGPCTVVLDADAAIQPVGNDSVVNSGAKMYAPRLISGRVAADAACLLATEGALLLVQVQKIRQATGQDLTRQTLVVVSLDHIAAIEFADVSLVKALGLPDPPAGTPQASAER